MKRTVLGAVLALGVVLTPAIAAAQSAYVYAVHGIPGQALGTDPALPVDVSATVGSQTICIAALSGFTFGEIRGPLALAPGTYTLGIRPANTWTPCGNAAVLSKTVTVAANTNYSVVAHLDADGSPVVSAFVNDLSRTDPGKARVQVHHTAAAPAVDITLARELGGPGATLEGVENGDSAAPQVRPGDYFVSIAPAGGNSIFDQPISFKPFTTTLVYAIGSLDIAGTFQLAARVIPSR